MQTILRTLAGAAAFAALAASAQPAPEVTLTRLDCGNGFNDQRRFSDTFAYTEPKVPFTFSCYVIRHGDDYVVWDTGYLPGSNPNAPTVTLLEQLAQMRVRPEQVKLRRGRSRCAWSMRPASRRYGGRSHRSRRPRTRSPARSTRK